MFSQIFVIWERAVIWKLVGNTKYSPFFQAKNEQRFVKINVIDCLIVLYYINK